MKKVSIFQVVGIGLIVCSFVLLGTSKLLAWKAQRSTAIVVEEIEGLLPERIEGSMEDYTNMSMPVIQIDGQDFSGLIDVPAFGVTLPIYDLWDSAKITSFPCRFFGSTYDGSLVIGGSDQSGQFDFCSKIDLGAHVCVTDLTGAEFDYRVTKISRSKTADADVLINDQPGLTLFVRDQYSLDYIVVRCSDVGDIV